MEIAIAQRVKYQQNLFRLLPLTEERMSKKNQWLLRGAKAHIRKIREARNKFVSKKVSDAMCHED